jgi:hypothetical protein
VQEDILWKDSVQERCARTDFRLNWEEVTWCQHCEAC